VCLQWKFDSHIAHKLGVLFCKFPARRVLGKGVEGSLILPQIIGGHCLVTATHVTLLQDESCHISALFRTEHFMQISPSSLLGFPEDSSPKRKQVWLKEPIPQVPRERNTVSCASKAQKMGNLFSQEFLNKVSTRHTLLAYSFRAWFRTSFRQRRQLLPCGNS
jgi:hypothetical protein